MNKVTSMDTEKYFYFCSIRNACDCDLYARGMKEYMHFRLLFISISNIGV